MDDIPAPRRGCDTNTLHFHPEWSPPWTTHPGEHWRELLNERGMSQVMLAELVDASAKHINQILLAKAMPSAALVIKMAEVLDVPAKLMWQLQSNYLFEEARHPESRSAPSS